MIVINIDKVLQEKKARETHKPTLRIILSEIIWEAEEEVKLATVEKPEETHELEKVNLSLKDDFVRVLDNQERDHCKS